MSPMAKLHRKLQFPKNDTAMDTTQGLNEFPVKFTIPIPRMRFIQRRPRLVGFPLGVGK